MGVFWHEIPFLMPQQILLEVHLLGASVSGWVKRGNGKIVAVGIVIVLLSGGGRGGLEWIFARDGAGGNSVE